MIASVYRTGLGATTRLPLPRSPARKRSQYRQDHRVWGGGDGHHLRQTVVVRGLKPEVVRKKMIMAIHELGGFRVC